MLALTWIVIEGSFSWVELMTLDEYNVNQVVIVGNEKYATMHVTLQILILASI